MVVIFLALKPGILYGNINQGVSAYNRLWEVVIVRVSDLCSSSKVKW